jgi:hypothetical protein
MSGNIIQNHVNGRHVRRDFAVNRLKQLDQFDLPFASGGCGPHTSCPCVERSKQIQGSATRIFMFHSNRTVGLRCLRVRLSGARLKACHFVDAKHHFVRTQFASVQVADRFDLLPEFIIPRHPGRKPRMHSPGFQPMVGQCFPDGFASDGSHDSGRDQLPTDLLAIPLRQRSARDLRTFAGQLDNFNSDDRGKKRAFARVPEDPSARPCHAPETDGTIFEDACRSCR